MPVSARHSRDLLLVIREQKNITLQAKIIRNLFVIPVFINDDGPYNFVLDTGSGLTLITDSALRDQITASSRHKCQSLWGGK